VSQPLPSTDWQEPVDEGPVQMARSSPDPAELDITPMIDITFLLIIFFLVCSTASMQQGAELPPARHGTAVSPFTCVVFTMVQEDKNRPATVYLGDGTDGTPLPEDPEAFESQVIDIVSDGVLRGKSSVLIKADRTVKEGEVAKLATAAKQVEGVRLYVAVLEVQ